MRRSGLLACLGLALAAGIANSASIPVPSFAAKTSYRTGGGENPSLVGVADLNGDGVPDALTLTGSRASVFLNKGDGSFRPRSDYQAGPSPDATALADLNGDGRPDLVTADRESGTVSVLLNRGDGSFAARRDFPAGGGIPTLTVADLNGDGKPDLVVGHGNVSVLVGNGDGTFQPRQDYGTSGLGVVSVAVADLNGDGKPDLAAAGGIQRARLIVFLGNGDATFQAPHDYSGLGENVSVADLNGDGRPDLVTSFPGCCVGAAVFLNRGDGIFGPPRAYGGSGGIIPATGGGVDSAQIADLNGDGRPDLVLKDEEAAGGDIIGLTVMLNRGDGTFGSRRDYRAAGDLSSIGISDVNGDGRPDLALADSNLDSVSLFLNKGDGRFQVRRDYPTDFLPGDIAVADLNGDGRQDLLTTTDHTVSVLLNRPGLCNVQDVWGMRPAVAKWRLARVNCRAVIRRVFDPKVRLPKGGLVDSQKPWYGAVLPAGGKVRLIVRFGRRG